MARDVTAVRCCRHVWERTRAPKGNAEPTANYAQTVLQGPVIWQRTNCVSPRVSPLGRNIEKSVDSNERDASVRTARHRWSNTTAWDPWPCWIQTTSKGPWRFCSSGSAQIPTYSAPQVQNQLLSGLQ